MKKILFIVLYIIFHITIMREARTALFAFQLNDEVVEHVQNSPHLSFLSLDTRLAYFEYENEDYHKFFHYKVPFGSFFLLGIVGLLTIGAHKKYFTALILIHFLVFLITSAIFLFDISIHYWLLIICDLLSRYLIPLCSLGLIPLALLDKRMVN